MSSLRALHSRFSYKTKLIFSCLLFCLVAIILGLIYLYHSIVATENNSLISTVKQRMEQSEANVHRTVESLQNSAYVLSTQVSINRFFTTRYYDEAELIKTVNNDIMPSLSWFEAISESVDSFRFITTNLYVPENEFIEHASRYTQEEWYQNALAATRTQGAYFEGLHPARAGLYSAAKATMVYSWFYPLLSSARGNYTLLEVTIDAKHLFEGILDIPIAASGFLFAMSADTLISGDNSNQWLEPFLHTAVGKQLLCASEPFDTTISQAEGTYYCRVLPIKEIGAVLGCIVSNSEIEALTMSARNSFVIASIGVVMAVLLFSYLASTALLHKTNEMLIAVKTIANGDFSVRIPVMGQDEISQLGKEINIMAEKINELINTVYVAECLEKESQLTALQSQVNPHFLFNVLETMKMAMELGEYDKLKIGLASLGGLLRYTLYAKGLVSLQEELHNLSYYISIQQILLDNRLLFSVDIPAEVQQNVEIMTLTLQPILENSIKHGFENRIGFLHITLTAKKMENGTELCISDNGTGISDERLAYLRDILSVSHTSSTYAHEGGIGLWNVNKRLVLTYGQDSALDIQQNETGGVKTRIFLPNRQPGQKEKP